MADGTRDVASRWLMGPRDVTSRWLMGPRDVASRWLRDLEMWLVDG